MEETRYLFVSLEDAMSWGQIALTEESATTVSIERFHGPVYELVIYTPKTVQV